MGSSSKMTFDTLKCNELTKVSSATDRGVTGNGLRCLQIGDDYERIGLEVNPRGDFHVDLNHGDLNHGSFMDSSPSNPRMNDPLNDLLNDLKNDLGRRIKQDIEDAVKPILASAFRTYVDARQKQQEAFLALEEKKLAMRRQKLQRPKRRHAGRFHPIRRLSSAKVLRPRKVQGPEVCTEASFKWAPVRGY